MLAKDIVAEALIILQIQPKTVEDRSGELEKLRKELKEDLETLNNSYSKLEEENKRLKETQSGEPIQEKINSGKPNMDRLREIVAGKFLSEKMETEEKQQFVKGGDKREWN